jgi:hypothetical protein
VYVIYYTAECLKSHGFPLITETLRTQEHSVRNALNAFKSKQGRRHEVDMKGYRKIRRWQWSVYLSERELDAYAAL